MVRKLGDIGFLGAEWTRANLLGLVFKALTAPPAILIFIAGMFLLIRESLKTYVQGIRWEIAILLTTVSMSIFLSPTPITIAALPLVAAVPVIRIVMFFFRNPFVWRSLRAFWLNMLSRRRSEVKKELEWLSELQKEL